MNFKTIAGVVLLLFAGFNIVYDAVVDTANMGALAILVTCLSAALGTLLLAQSRMASRQSRG